MRNIFLFMMASIDGFMEGENHDLSWHNVDEEFNRFAVEQMKEADTIVFGRKTYQLMEDYWSTDAGLQDDPVVAHLMNNTPKVVFSKTLETVSETDVWKNVRLAKDNVAEEVRKLQSKEGKSIIVLGSNNLCVTLLSEKLLDEVRIMVNPVAIGQGTRLFQGLEGKQKFTLLNTRNFINGNILLSYKPEYTQ